MIHNTKKKKETENGSTGWRRGAQFEQIFEEDKEIREEAMQIPEERGFQ